MNNLMRNFLAIIATCISSLCLAQPAALPLFSDEIEGGALGEVCLVDSTANHLRYAITTKVDPANPADPDLPPSNRWFYFMASGVKDKTLSLDITFNDSKRPFYSYDNVNFMRFSSNEVAVENSTITFTPERDTLFVAYFTPYTMSRNLQKITEWNKVPNVQSFDIGTSMQGAPLRMLAIAEGLSPKSQIIPDERGRIELAREDRNRPIVYIHCRIHPSETPCSWHLEAMIERLIEDSNFANALRQSAIFYILPFVNPDGVTQGMSRSDSRGVNMEINYDASPEVTSPEVVAIKRFFDGIEASGFHTSLMLNTHSQSATKTCYWTHSAESTSLEYNRRMMLLGALTAYENPYFKLSDLSFSAVKSQYLEGLLFNKFKGRCLSVTFETPYTYYSNNPEGEWVTLENLAHQGATSLRAVGDILGIGARVVAEEPRHGGVNARGVKRLRDTRRISPDERSLYMGRSCLVSRRAGAWAEYRANLTAGRYNIYMWQVGRLPSKANVKDLDTTRNEWRKVGSIDHKSDGVAEYRHRATSAGEIFDRVIFVAE